ncbi:MAG: hypothetical protein J6X55_14360 [Victivallales bacterium]|nr:hypothetical protein [Victivallales bacterium]
MNLLKTAKVNGVFDLEHPKRLIITPITLPIPIDADGKYIWADITDALLVEIVDYHKEG